MKRSPFAMGTLLIFAIIISIAHASAGDFPFTYEQPSPSILFINTTHHSAEFNGNTISTRVRTPSGLVHSEAVSLQWDNISEEWMEPVPSTVWPNCSYYATTHPFADWTISYVTDWWTNDLYFDLPSNYFGSLSDGAYRGVPAIILDQSATYGASQACEFHVMFYFFKESGSFVMGGQTVNATEGSLKYSFVWDCPWNKAFPSLQNWYNLRGRRITLNYTMKIKAIVENLDMLATLLEYPLDEGDAQIYRMIALQPRPDREPDGVTRPYAYGCDWLLQGPTERPLPQDLSSKDLSAPVKLFFDGKYMQVRGSWLRWAVADEVELKWVTFVFPAYSIQNFTIDPDTNELGLIANPSIGIDYFLDKLEYDPELMLLFKGGDATVDETDAVRVGVAIGVTVGVVILLGVGVAIGVPAIRKKVFPFLARKKREENLAHEVARSSSSEPLAPRWERSERPQTTTNFAE